jgi:hypothetical protein
VAYKPFTCSHSGCVGTGDVCDETSVAFPQAEKVEQSVIMRDGVTQWQLEQHNRRSCPTGH